MVSRLEGMVNSNPIIFSWVGGDKWEATIPANLTGRYIVGITAYDDAGNMAYVTRMLFSVDPETLCVHLEPYPYEIEILPDLYRVEILKEPDADIDLHNYSAEILPDSYWGEIVCLDPCTDGERR
jgi:hypothetical protein